MTDDTKGKGLPALPVDPKREKERREVEQVDRIAHEIDRGGSTSGQADANAPGDTQIHGSTTQNSTGSLDTNNQTRARLPRLPADRAKQELIPTAAIKRRDMPFDNPIGRTMSIRDLESLNVDVNSHSNDVASNYELLVLSELLNRIGISAGSQQECLLDIAWCCKDVGATAQSTFNGFCPGSDRRRSEIVGLIKEASTLRRVCAYFSKFVWNLMLINNEPPTNWAAKGYKYEQRFAAFDFFHGVLNSGALHPEGGLIRDPSNEEILANTTCKEVSLRRAIFSRGIKSSNFGEVSGADIGLVPENSFKK